ncbi:Fis family transcriptional regulator [Nakamurella flava]|uniref:Fis family transcriptional regulator n=1 Tax=Nakamurella flava TaxID=2576308 RepID=A0A4U6QFI1_9ACTN|nr:helix-turn-helix domain-containing protein [Nakamurella flava]TKV58776.1 Fis family transcriptional regulator [Nakamurella flava]
MRNRGDYRLALATARAELIEGDALARPEVPDLVQASWRRSLTSGVSPTALHSRYTPDLDLSSRLVRCAQPVVSRLIDQLADVPSCVVLTDSKARIMLRQDSTPWISRVLDRVSFAQGFDYAEGAVGTNGVGTVLEFGASVAIVGPEHFVESLQAFACTGAPVRDPFTGRIEGVLDVTCLQEQYTPIMHSLARSAAAEIERRLVRDRNESQQALFDVYARVEARTREAVVAVGPRVTMANTALTALLDSADQAALADHMRFLIDQRPVRVDDRVDLPSGLQIRLRGSAAEFGGDVAGMVGVVTRCRDLVVDEDVITGRPAGGWRPGGGAVVDPRAGTGSHTPAMNAAITRVRTALRSGRSVLVVGEPGTGRHTLLRNEFRGLGPRHRVVAVAADQLVGTGLPTEVTGLDRAGDAETLLVVRDVDRLGAAAGAALLDRLARRAGRVHLAGTSGPGGPGREQPLLAAFDDSVWVPPLRNRTADFPALARSIVEDLSPGGRIRLTDEVVATLVRHRWPGNVTELRAALDHAVRRRPVGTLEIADLPASCQSAPKNALREVDRVERDAIVAALRETGGNRKAAAEVLGLARSTLYRKIAEYGVTD